MTTNEREEQILKLAFEQWGVKVLCTKPVYQNFILMNQFMPDLIIMELPHLCIEQQNFAKRVRAYKRTRSIPIIGYGNKVDNMIKLGITSKGITVYLERPIKFSSLIALIQGLLKPQNKKIQHQEKTGEEEK